MYLKSLTLKGFKSFADRTVLKFEPGLAAIVGPNGSGKSNISDAVLWVLGERNAKHLRGQSMEDVIFSGSSARKPVGLAEVELCLDNSDGTLPVEFSEVSIGRRMYRSGESEYLINGSVVRRLDVLDILHDSGLGTGTHSIISQGNLDSVLSSKPEDRRALIEEAAGILKHKERKARSERKLERMAERMNHVEDIVHEVERQLKPLERKAKKALTFKELDQERSELRLRIAADDLRRLQAKWDEVQKHEEELKQQIEERQKELSQAEKELDELQSNLSARGLQESSLNNTMRRGQNYYERINSTVMLLVEKKRQAEQEYERIVQQFEDSKRKEAHALEELSQATDQYEQARTAHAEAQKVQEEKEKTFEELVQERDDISMQIETLMADQRALLYTKDTLEAEQKALAQNVSVKQAKAEVLQSQLLETKARLDEAEKEASAQKDAARALAQELASVQAKAVAAKEAASDALKLRDDSREELDSLREELTRVVAERQALEELERASNKHNPVRSYLDEKDHGFSQDFTPLLQVINSPKHLEVLVETLLGDDLQSLLFSDNDRLSQAIGALQEHNQQADASFISSDIATHVLADAFDKPAVLSGLSRLIDELDIREGYYEAVSSLLGDVYLTDTFQEAFSLSKQFDEPVRFVSLDGCVVTPQGHVSLLDLSLEEREQGALSRKRSFESLCVQQKKLEERFDTTQEKLTKAEEQLRASQQSSLFLSEQLAHTKGRSQAAEASCERAQKSLENIKSELASLEEEQQKNQDFLEKTQPDSDELARKIADINAQIDSSKTQVESFQSALDPLRKCIVAESEELSELRLSTARLGERVAYAQHTVSSRQHEISSSEREHAQASERMMVVRGVIARSTPLMSTLNSILRELGKYNARLESQAQEEQSFSFQLHERISQSTMKVRSLHERFDQVSARHGELRVEKGKLEVQVENAITLITQDCSTSLETALALEPLEQRDQTCLELERLETRIKNLGPINPDAAEEFNVIKQRHTFLTSQLSDMKTAQQSLTQIVKVIDDRMRDHFIVTFNQVNENFSEIFSTLFPGGKAHLSFDDPENLESTGVDVHAQPIGKRVRKMSLLSGGEKSMTAMALLFAVYRIRQTPFYILDEVEAALDDSNLRRLMLYLDAIRNQTQFIMITHQRRTMESADILYGVSMQADGVTKVLSQKIDQAVSKGN